MKKVCYFLMVMLLTKSLTSFAAKVDTIQIASTAMNKTYKTAVAIPDSYTKNQMNYPVMYLLHGAWGHFSDWLNKTPDKMAVKNLADEYNIIIVMPEGETFSWYLNSPVNKQSQFESYIIDDVIKKIDATYRTVKDKKGRVISGLSMGGHGALYLSARHPELFCAAGSMSGGLDFDIGTYKLPPTYMNIFKMGFQQLLGNDTTTYSQYAVVNMADKLKTNGVKLIFDCGTEDFLIEPNRELHRRLIYSHTPHSYTERPGNHNFEYWQGSLPSHVLFFYNIFKEGQVAVAKN